MAKNTPKTLKNQVIYSVFVRNHTEEGTFRALEKDLDRIKSLGVDIIWLMPIHPVGEAQRKGTEGSPYAISDYRKVNPKFGTIEDLQHLADEIHARGMKCIIDVVYNHTSPDSWLVKNHPEYFYEKPEGGRGNKVGEWSDIVDLDYSKDRGLWDYQIETLKMWAKIIDGFRCDVAPLVPLDFWLEAREEVEKVHPGCIWLTESVEPDFIIYHHQLHFPAHSDCEMYQAFDMCYDYDIKGYFDKYIMGTIPLSAYLDKVNMQEYIYPENYVKLRFLENHDQMRAKHIIPDENDLLNWTAFLYFQKGCTLLYGGQEVECDHTPSLFYDDKVNWNTGKDISGYLKKLYDIKQNPIMADGIYRVTANDKADIAVGVYTLDDKKLAGIFSLKGKSALVKVDIPDGIYENQIDGTPVLVERGTVAVTGKSIIIG